MAGKVLNRVGEHVAAFKPVPGPHGKFDILIDGTDCPGRVVDRHVRPFFDLVPSRLP